MRSIRRRTARKLFFCTPIVLIWTSGSLPMAGQAPQSSAPDPAGRLEAVRTSITVNEQISAETPSNISDFTGEEISRIPGLNLDDRLRMVPGFSLFRRNSSIIANPTTQGVSLRGIGSTGASRTLVLFDGVPYNDPFGGWVFWTRFTPENLARVEISRGAASSLFGNLALGGAINIFPEVPSTRHFSAGAEAGTQNTYDVWGGYSESFQHFALSAEARGFTTEGYYVVPGNLRGAIDRKANVRFVNDTVRLDGFYGRNRLYGWFNSVVEERGNGTYITQNSSTVGTAALRYAYDAPHDSFSLTGFGTNGQYHSTFSSISNSRNTETLVSTQTVPEDAFGGSTIYHHSQSRFNATAGADVEQDHGFSTDRFSPTFHRVAGGTLLQHGEFVQTDLALGPARFFLGGRHQFTGQDHQFFSPSGGLSLGRERWRARGSVYRAFRSPTLNELFRQFRAGNTTTLANAQLQPETLLGAEIGADYTMEHGVIRVTAFRNDLHNLITNVTLSSSASAITRQRQNAGNAIGRGVEVSADHRWRDWTAQAAYLFTDSRYSSGLRVAQVPRSQGSANLTWARKGTLAAASFRSSSSQFDDDQNRFLLPGFAVVQMVVRQQLVTRLSASLELTNLLDRTFYTAFTPTPTIGDPRIIRGGLLLKFN